MKRTNIWLIAPALLGVLPTFAPARADDRPFHVGVRAGFTISKLRNLDSGSGSFEALKGVAAGVEVAWPLARSLEIQSELRYIQKGVSLGEFESTDVYGNRTGTFEALHVVDALELPILLRCEIPTGGRFHPVLEAGPYVSFEIAERSKFTGDLKSSAEFDLLKDTDYGAVLGAGLEIDAGPGRWTFESRYEPGLADLGSFSTSDRVHSGAWVFATGYRY